MIDDKEKITVHFTEEFKESKKMFIEGFHLKIVLIIIYLFATLLFSGGIFMLFSTLSIPPEEFGNTLKVVELYTYITALIVISMLMYSTPLMFNRIFKKTLEKLPFKRKFLGDFYRANSNSF